MPDAGVSCSACLYFSTADDKGGICKRYPPQVMIVPGDLVGQFRPANLFPAVSKDAWCGEYAPDHGADVVLPDSRLIGEAHGEA